MLPSFLVVICFHLFGKISLWNICMWFWKKKNGRFITYTCSSQTREKYIYFISVWASFIWSWTLNYTLKIIFYRNTLIKLNNIVVNVWNIASVNRRNVFLFCRISIIYDYAFGLRLQHDFVVIQNRLMELGLNIVFEWKKQRWFNF